MSILKSQAEATHRLTLYSDAKAKTQRFAITNELGHGLWYGREFYETEQSACERAAAENAIYLAGLARKAKGLEKGALELVLKVDAHWLTYWRGNNKATVLGRKAFKAGVQLVVEWLPGSENPADKLTVKGGYCKVADNLEQVVNMIEPV